MESRIKWRYVSMSPWQDERTRKDRANQPMNHLKAEMSNFSMNTACSFYQVCLHPSLRAHNYIKFRHGLFYRDLEGGGGMAGGMEEIEGGAASW